MSGLEHSESTGDKVTIELSTGDLALIRAALEEYLASFSHDEGDLVDRIKLLLAKWPDGGLRAGSRFQRLTL